MLYEIQIKNGVTVIQTSVKKKTEKFVSKIKLSSDVYKMFTINIKNVNFWQ